MFFETDGVQVNAMHVRKASAFKVWSFKGIPWMPEGAIYGKRAEKKHEVAPQGPKLPSEWLLSGPRPTADGKA